MTELENHGFASVSNFNNCSRQESSMDFEITGRKLLGISCEYFGNSMTGRGNNKLLCGAGVSEMWMTPEVIEEE